MKGLVIDCAVSRLTIAAKNDDKMCAGVFDIGMRQSEILVTEIDSVLSKINLSSSELDYTALTIGPGSFTGLRLAISALKAIELAFNVPVYGISSLEAYSYPFHNFEKPVLSCIDANKDKYYANLWFNDKILLEDGDWEINQIISKLSDLEEVIIAGPDAQKFEKILSEANKQIKIFTLNSSVLTTDSLFAIAENKKAANNPSLKDFDGPVYLRASEAEIKLNQ